MRVERRCSESFARELRLFVEDLCCNLCVFRHVEEQGLMPEEIDVTREAYLGVPGAFADIRVQCPGSDPYFVEVKYGYPPSRMVSHLTRKYGVDSLFAEKGSGVILVVDAANHHDWAAIQSRVENGIYGGLALEVWDEEHLLELAEDRFGLAVNSLREESMVDLKAALDRAQGRFAFEDEWSGDDLQLALLWYFGFWRLRQLVRKEKTDLRSILSPGVYSRVAVIKADLCSFSSYVRDTRDEEVVRQVLTAFYSRARHAIHNSGGMIYEFVGDEIVGLFGIPDRPDGYLESVLDSARALADIGSSVSNEWQRHLDRVQKSQGVHISIALGDVQVVSLRPFARPHLGMVSDAINVASRLLSSAESGEVVASNSFFQGLDPQSRADFDEIAPVQAKNVGRILAWKKSLNATG